MKKLVIEWEYFRYKIITSDKRTNTKAHARISSLVHSNEPFKKIVLQNTSLVQFVGNKITLERTGTGC